MPKGGYREGAGRPKGTGIYAQPTTTMRVPEAMVSEIKEFIIKRKVKLPFYSCKVAAGAPMLTDDHIDGRVDLNDLLIKSPSNTFLVKVTGFSMIEAGINPEDILIVDRKQEARHGKIVVVSVSGELTVKRLYKKQGKVLLIPENKEYEAIDITSNTEVVVLGVVTNVIHNV